MLLVLHRRQVVQMGPTTRYSFGREYNEEDLFFVLSSFHVGSGCQDATAYVKALKNARSLFDYAETIGHHFTLLDIGGGFPGTENAGLKFEEVSLF